MWSDYWLQAQLAWGWIWFQVLQVSWVKQAVKSITHWMWPPRIEADTFEVHLSLLPTLCVDKAFRLVEIASADYVSNDRRPLYYTLKKFRDPLSNAVQYFGYRGNYADLVLSSLEPLNKPLFLAVQYVCESTNVFLELPRAFFVPGSEILSKEFILWWLEYHYTGRFHFNRTYKINLTDFHLNFFSIGYDEFLVLDPAIKPLQYQIQRLV